MNGARSTYMRKGYLLTALAAAVLLAASSGTAWAQATITIESVSLSAATVNEGGEATATVKFTVTNGTEAAIEPANATVGFEFNASDGRVGMTNASATQATAANFIGLSGTDTENQEFVPVARVRVGAKRSYEAERTFRLNHDLDAENAKFSLNATAGWNNVTADEKEGDGVYIIVDDETQEYSLSIPRANRGAILEDGTAAQVTLTADPRRTNPLTVPTFTVVTDPASSRLYPRGWASPIVGTGDALGGSVSDAGNPGASARFDIGTIGAAVDKNRENDTLTLQLHTGGVGTSTVVADLSISVVDIHQLPAADAIEAKAKDEDGKDVTEIVEGGDPVYLTITVDRGIDSDTTNFATDEELTIDIRASTGQSGDVEVEPARVTLDENGNRGKQSTDVDIMVTALSDDDVGTEDIVLNLVVSGSDPDLGSGTSTGTFTIAAVDKTTKQVEPKDEADAYPVIMAAMEAGAGDEGFNPGESFSVMTSDLFTVADGYSAAYGASVEGGGVSVSASGDSITVEAKSATDGEAKVTVTATAKMAASSFIPSQTVSNIAEITFPVTVVDKALVVMLEMPANVMNGNIVEGESYDIKVSANRMVMEDTDVMIMRDRAGSDAGEDDFSVSMATIMAGYDSATAELMVTEDMMPDSGTNDNMGEQLVLFGMVNGEQTNALTFTIWDQAVPALPLFGQLLLALFLMLGGARLYRRRQG